MAGNLRLFPTMEGTFAMALSELNGISISRLRGQVRGQVVTPDHPAYDQARTTFYGGFDRRPQAIVQAADAADVAAVVARRGKRGWSWRSAAVVTAPPGTASS